MAESKKNKNKSTSCKKTNNKKIDMTESTTIDDRQIRLRDEATQSMLQRKKLHLVLDLDNTLIHTSSLPKKLTLEDRDFIKLKRTLEDDLHDIVYGHYALRLRPGVRDFLKEASTMFDFTIYTMADRLYAEDVAGILDKSKDRSWFNRIVSYDDHPKDRQKGLHHVLSNERMVLIVDDLVEVWRTVDRDNLINVSPYCFFPPQMKYWPKLDGVGEHDDELARVMSILKAVHSNFYSGKSGHASKDVRQVLKRVRTNSVRDAGAPRNLDKNDQIGRMTADFGACGIASS